MSSAPVPILIVIMEDALKRFVWPALKALIAVITATALVKIAFFPSQKTGATADITPGYSASVKTVSVTTGTIANTVEIKGRVVQDASVDVQADLAGVVDSVAVEKDQQVNAGEPLLYIKHSEPQSPITRTDEQGNVTQTPVADKVTWSTIYAPVSGTVTPKVIKQQDTGVGVVVATIAPSSYSATGTVSAAQQYRLTNAPTTATLTMEGGPSPFQCSNLKIGTKTAASTTAGGEGQTTTSADGTSVEIRCAVPADQKVFAGMSTTISVDAGSASDTLVVPATAVEGKIGSGFVWLVPDSGDVSKAVKTAVTLGITDGTNIQVTDGLKADQKILQFVPNKDTQRTGTPDTCEQDNSACYDSNGKEIL